MGRRGVRAAHPEPSTSHGNPEIPGQSTVTYLSMGSPTTGAPSGVPDSRLKTSRPGQKTWNRAKTVRAAAGRHSCMCGGVHNRQWIVQLFCGDCDHRDTELPILAVPFSTEDGRAHSWQRIDDYSMAILGLGALRMSFRDAFKFDKCPIPPGLPEHTDAEKAQLAQLSRIFE